MSQINISKVKLTNPKHSEVISNNFNVLVKTIKDHAIDTYRSLDEDKALNLEFIKFLCNSLESADVKQPSNPVYRINKRDLIVKVLNELFPYKHNEDYVKIVEQFIDFLHNNQMIKSSGVAKVVKSTIINYVSKKCLNV